MAMRKIRSLLLATGCLMILLGPRALASVLVEDVRLWRAPDHTRVVMDL